MKRDYTYFCNSPGCSHEVTVAWSIKEFTEKRDSVDCPYCGAKMLIDISPRNIKDNGKIGNKVCLNSRLNYSKAANGRDGRSHF